MPFRTIREFMRLEAAAGIVLFVAAVLALIIDNTSWSAYYQHALEYPLSLDFGFWKLTKPLILWVNEGLMMIFFLLVGLEVKREMFEGELRGWAKASLPAFAAVGGMVVPALIYVFFNYGDATALRGWAIPTATDIAFSLGILSLLGSRVPPALKVFLTALAIFDDIGGIVIIAVFYTQHIAWALLLLALICLLILFLLNRFAVTNFLPYVIVGILLWGFVLKSGVHATLAGVALGFAVPLQDKKTPGRSPLRDWEHGLHPWVAFLILPIFAFCNAGISFAGMHVTDLLAPIPLGIAAGLLFGKQFGVWLAVWMAVRFKCARMPHGATWRGVYGIGLVSGVGFTMSLFIGTLAFARFDPQYLTAVRLGVLTGSFVSGLLGYLLLRSTPRKQIIQVDTI